MFYYITMLSRYRRSRRRSSRVYIVHVITETQSLERTWPACGCKDRRAEDRREEDRREEDRREEAETRRAGR